MINFHAPISVEDELRLLGVNSGNYVLNFKMDLTASAALINSTGSYVYEGVPLNKILSEYTSSYPKIYNNKIFPKSLALANGSLKPHDWNKAAAQSIYSDLVIENDNPVPEGTKREVYLQVINANYIEIDEDGNIIGFSPLLETQISTWKANNYNRTPETKDYFGVDKVITYAYSISPVGTEGEVNLVTEDVYPVNFEDMKVDFGLEEVITYPEPTPPEDPPVEGEEPTEPTEPVTPAEPIIEYIPKKAPEGVTKLAIYADDASIDNPVIGLRNVYIPLIKYTPSTSAVTLPRYKIGEQPETFYQGLFKNIIQDFSSKYSFSKSSLGSYIKFTSLDEAPKLLLTGIYVGRSLTSSEANLRKNFLSFPESVVRETGIEVLYSYRNTEETNTELPEFSSLFSAPLLSVSAGKVSYQLYTSLWTIGYESESLEVYNDRYRIRYEISDEVTTDIYRFRWESTTETVLFSKTWEMSWESENSRLYKSEYYIRFESELPEFRDFKDFYNISWDKDLSQTYTTHYRIAYEATQYRTYTSEWSFTWDISLIDSVIVKPYYLELYDNEEYIDCVSYQVYADYQAIREYMLIDKFYMFFSNAPKYEMIMFNTERVPYSGIFLESIEDSSLEDRTGVPDNFILLGNYTIKNINIKNSLSLDIIGLDKQLNEYKSYWVPEVVEDYLDSMILMDDNYSSALPLDGIYLEYQNTDEVELEVITLETGACCFIQTSVGSRCSPY